MEEGKRICRLCGGEFVFAKNAISRTVRNNLDGADHITTCIPQFMALSESVRVEKLKANPIVSKKPRLCKFCDGMVLLKLIIEGKWKAVEADGKTDHYLLCKQRQADQAGQSRQVFESLTQESQLASKGHEPCP